MVPFELGARIIALGALALLGGCGGDETKARPSLHDAGSPPCGDTEVAGPDGCVAVGVPPDGCAPGFVRDERASCQAVLPAEACGAGQMALPGETACRDVSPCGAAPWGDAPVDATTEYVDAAFTGTSDGSAAKPWATIGDAIAAAAAGALIAVAAGTYAEDVVIVGKQVRIWGRCPALVEIRGAGVELGTIFIDQGANSSLVHGVAVTGGYLGVAGSGSKDLLVENVWVHDTPHTGIDFQSEIGPTSVVVRGSLIERVMHAGVLFAGVEGAIEASVVRDTLPDKGGTLGVGIDGEIDPPTGDRATVAVRGSLVERVHDVGINVAAGDLVVDATLVRDVMPQEKDGARGDGITIQFDPTADQPRSVATVTGTVIERVTRMGVTVVGSDATIERTVVRDGLADAAGELGRGVHIQSATDGSLPSEVTLRASVVERNHDVGVLVTSSHLVLEGAWIRETLAQASDGKFGDGLTLASAIGPATLDLTGGRIETSARAGISSFGGIAHIGIAVIACNPIALDAEDLGGQLGAFDDRGGVTCGCGAAFEICKVLSSSLEPPSPLP